MRRDISEADWREFKRVHQALQQRFCQRELDNLAGIVGSTVGDAYDRYSRAQEFLRRCDEEFARAFDDFRRSTAVMQLVIMRGMGLLNDDDLRRFSESTQDVVRRVDALRNAEPSDSSE